MFDISKIDTNFKIETNFDKPDIKIYNIDSVPFKIYGVFKENGKYRRIPEAVAGTVSDGVYSLHTCAAGGRVKFVTDSSYVAIYAKMERISKMPHFTLTGSAGFDLYVNNLFAKTYFPPSFDMQDGYEGIFEMSGNELREITINFPLYSCVCDLYIGLQESAVIKEPKPYKTEKPIVYYGSSITQGGCASRPGMSYQAIISRDFDCDHINLGFSGNARGEDEIAEYIKNLDMSVFVLDYDHNSPSTEHLFETQRKMFYAVREKHPDLPVIMMSRPKYHLNAIEKERRDAIEKTYLEAVKSGDKNVYFLDGKALTELCKDSGTVDNCHPTDFGFASMAKAVSDVLKQINIF